MTSNAGINRDLPLGRAVYTMDGDKLGTVKEVQGRSFKVDALLEPDYWLTTDTINSVSEERVSLIFNKEQLVDYQQENPSIV